MGADYAWQGGDDCITSRPTRTFFLQLAIVNPIGSGDAMLAGIAAGIVDGLEMLPAIRRGVACGSANVLTLSTQSSEVERLESEVKVLPQI